MMNKTTHSFKGMRKDVDSLKFSPEYLEDARNIRLTPGIKDTLLSVTCERYPEPVAYLNLLDIVNISEDYAVYDVKNIFSTSCNLNDILVLFMSNNIVSTSKSITLLEEKLVFEINKLFNYIKEATENNDNFRTNANAIWDKIANIYKDLQSLASKDTIVEKYSPIYESIYSDHILYLFQKVINNNASIEEIKNHITTDVYYTIGQVQVSDGVYQDNHIIKSDTETTKLDELITEFLDKREIKEQTYNYNSIIAININTNLYSVLFSGYKNLDTEEEVNYLNLGENIDALPYYESKEVQKVYWVDGVNQPRVINIAATKEIREKWTVDSFNFVLKPELKDYFNVEKLEQYGLFAPGVIQYCFTYFNKNGAESNIIDISPLMYIKDFNKGNSPEDSVGSNSFRISIGNADPSFEYARVYSIHRTSLNAEPTCKHVDDILLKKDSPATKTFELELLDKSKVNININNNSSVKRNIQFKVINKEFYTRKEYNDFLLYGEKCSVYEDASGNIIIECINKVSLKKIAATASETNSPEITLMTFGSIDEGNRNGPVSLKPSINDSIVADPGGQVIGPGGGSSGGGTAQIPITGVNFISENINLIVGQSYTLGYTWAPSNTTQLLFDFSTGNSSIVTVNGNVIKAIAKGNTTITIVSRYNNNIKDTITVVVEETTSEEDDIDLNSDTGFNSAVFKNALKQYGLSLSYNYNKTLKLNTTSTPIDISLDPANNTNSIIDNGLIGSVIAPTDLLYKGGEAIIPSTIAEKDGTLFLGNITLSNAQTRNFLNVKEAILESGYESDWITKTSSFKSNAQDLFINVSKNINFYPSYKYCETYRFGIQLQDETGKWSSALPLVDSACTKSSYLHENDGTYTIGRPSFVVTLGENILTTIKEGNYKRIRPVVVLPEDYNREILAQGIICPTVYNLQQRANDVCAAQSSWFFRPTQGEKWRFGTFPDQSIEQVSSALDKPKIINSAFWKSPGAFKRGHIVEYRHDSVLPPSYSHAAEFPFMWYNTHVTYPSTSTTPYYPIYLDDNKTIGKIPYTAGNGTMLRLDTLKKVQDLALHKLDYYAPDRNIITFHSPEIEFNKISDISECKLRIVGCVKYSHTVRDADISQEAASFEIDNVVSNSADPATYSLNLWTPLKYKVDLEGEDKGKFYRNNYIFLGMCPWDRQTVYKKKLKANRSSRLHVYNNSYYFPYVNSNNAKISNSNVHNYNLADSKIFNGSVDNIVLKYPKYNWANGYQKSTFIYKGNVDDLLTSFKSGDIIKGYWLAHGKTNILDVTAMFNDSSLPVGSSYYAYMGRYLQNNVDAVETPIAPLGHSYQGYYETEPVQITYKSSSHGVLVLDNNDDKSLRYILPRLKSTNYNQELSEKTWDPYYYSDGYYGKIEQKEILYTDEEALEYNPIISDTTHEGYLYIADLYRSIDSISKFGSKEQDKNLWIPAGKSLNIEDVNSLRVEYYIGDTFFSQYDCLKTYPRNNTNFNQVTEIGSFWVETRVNTSTRYDNNKNSVSNIHVSPTNFNLFNPVYDQKDNFFSSRVLESDILDNIKFPSTFTWSKQKYNGDKIDVWTNITMAAVYDLNGIDGEIVKLYNFNNELFSFQPKGINHILFNSRVQLNSSDGVPIEISNGYRVSGARKISSIGTSHIKCVNDNNSSVFFTDSLTKGIYSFNGSVVESLSDKLNFSVWASNNITNDSHVYVDHTNKNIYIRNKVKGLTKDSQEVLGYSELLGEFESFYDYIYPIFKTNTSTYTLGIDDIFIKDDITEEETLNKSIVLYKLYSNTKKSNDLNFTDPYISIIHNNSDINNKCYSHVEFKADPIEQQSDFYIPIKGIKIETQDTYNYKSFKEVSYKKYYPSSIKKKFNSWKVEIPRGNNSSTLFKRTIERVQNPWAKISLYLDRTASDKNNEIGNEFGYSIPYLDVYFLE